MLCGIWLSFCVRWLLLIKSENNFAKETIGRPNRHFSIILNRYFMQWGIDFYSPCWIVFKTWHSIQKYWFRETKQLSVAFWFMNQFNTFELIDRNPSAFYLQANTRKAKRFIQIFVYGSQSKSQKTIGIESNVESFT